MDFTSSKEYFLLKNYKWLILKNQNNIKYPGKSFCSYKLRRYVNTSQIEKMLFDIDPNPSKTCVILKKNTSHSTNVSAATTRPPSPNCES